MKSCYEYWSTFSRRKEYKFRALEGLFGVFAPLLGIAVPNNSLEFFNFF